MPAAALTELEERSGPDFADASAEIGDAVRVCGDVLDSLLERRRQLSRRDAQALRSSCMETGNRQFFDLAAQAFGMRRHIEDSIEMFEASIDQDPHALNARLGIAVTYHLAGRYSEEIPHLRFLMRHIPDDAQVLRLAIQAGTWSGDDELVSEALATLRRTNPAMVDAAERFLANPPPRPPSRSNPPDDR